MFSCDYRLVKVILNIVSICIKIFCLSELEQINFDAII